MTREDFGLEAHEPESESAEQSRTIKDMNADERPRERAIAFGIGSLTTAELLALVLRTGQKGLPITDLCRQLMNDNNNSLLTLERRSRAELMLTKGIGDTKALQIEAMMELMRRHFQESIDATTRKIEPLNCSVAIHKRMRSRISNLDHEEVWILLVNRRNQVVSEFRITSGSYTASVFDTKMVLKRALLENADGVIMCHNHPSGNLNTSPQDDHITKKMRDACNIMSLRFIDHLIISTDGFYSYRDSGRLN